MRVRRIIWAYQDWMTRRKLAKRCPEDFALYTVRKHTVKRHGRVSTVDKQYVEFKTGLLNAERWL